MTVAAFHLGLMSRTEELICLLKSSFLYQANEKPSQLRRKMNRADFLSFVDEDELKALLNAVLQLCNEGLCKRGYSEEIYLSPLFERARTLTSPSGRLLQNEIKKVILEYAKL